MVTPRYAIWVLAAVLGLGCGDGCGEKEAAPSAERAPTEGRTHGLTEEQSKQVLAKVGDTVITLGDFAERLANLSPYLRARYTSVERRKEFLDNMIRFELLALEARRRGHQKREDVVRAKRQAMVREMMREMFDEKGIQLSDITDAEIRAYYDEHKSDFSKPAQVRASHILLEDEATAERVLAQATAQPQDMKAFRKLAEKYNTDKETLDRFGDLRFFALSPDDDDVTVPDEVRKAAFTLKQVGDVYPTVVKSARGFHVIKLTAKRAALDRSIDDARRLIQNRLWREKRADAIEKFIADLRKKAKVEEDLEALKLVEIDPNAPMPDQDVAVPEAETGDMPEAEAPPKPETKPKPQAETAPKPETKPKPEPQATPKPKPAAETAPKPAAAENEAAP